MPWDLLQTGYDFLCKLFDMGNNDGDVGVPPFLSLAQYHRDAALPGLGVVFTVVYYFFR